jgi:NADPH:quinone reductase-like Zn-dependent oxidoreductase
MAMTVSKTTPETLPQTMTAIVRREYGPATNIHVEKINTPTPSSGQVLIEVHAAGVDRGQWHVMAGMPYLMRLAGFGVTKPKEAVLGVDVAGRVVAVGDGVERFGLGDAVYGFAKGSFAEYAVAEESKLALQPKSIDHQAAAVVPVSGITALQALTDVGRLEAGHSVLVIGASGGVGSYVVQLAKALGARVTGVASGAKADLVRSLGADDTIDYQTTEYLDGSATYDLIVDIGGRNPVRKLRRALDRKGTLVIVGGEGGGRWTGGIGRGIRAVLLSPFLSQRLTMFISSESHERLERLSDFIESGRVVPALERRYTLDEVPAAINDIESGRTRGKSVVTVR